MALGILCLIVTGFPSRVRAEAEILWRAKEGFTLAPSPLMADLNMDVEIVGQRIVREEDGLAMSSRNATLDTKQRSSALALKRSLDAAVRAFEDGERSAAALVGLTKSQIEATPGAVVDYVSVVDAESIRLVEVITSRAVLAVAVNFGDTRLIDNVVLSAP